MSFIRKTLACVLLLSLTACASLRGGLEAPSVQLTSIDLLETRSLSQRFRIGLTLTNPNARALPVRGLTYSLALEGVDVVQGASNKIPELPPYSETPLELEATASLINALRLLNEIMQSQSDKPVAYTFSSKVDVVGLPRPVRLVESGEVPLR